MPLAVVRVLDVKRGSATSGLVLCREDLAGQVEHGQWARDTSRCATGNDCKVPTADETDETETAGNLEKLSNVCDVGSGGGMGDGKVGGGDESEETDQTEEGEGEEHVDSEAGNEEDEGDEAPDLLSEDESCHIDGRTHMVTLWKPWDELYAAPSAPPAVAKPDRVW